MKFHHYDDCPRCMDGCICGDSTAHPNYWRHQREQAAVSGKRTARALLYIAVIVATLTFCHLADKVAAGVTAAQVGVLP
jgi:hypothetical protein